MRGSCYILASGQAREVSSIRYRASSAVFIPGHQRLDSDVLIYASVRWAQDAGRCRSLDGPRMIARRVDRREDARVRAVEGDNEGE